MQALEEDQYLNLIQYIIENGKSKTGDIGSETISIFGHQMRFSLEDNIIPLLTTKRMFWKGIVEELLWFISGDTNSKTLSEKRINIWNKNSTRKFLDSRGLNYEEGDLGPIYGFQWRHFGDEYIDSNHSYGGFDQLQYVIDEIRNNPGSRRIIMNSWNPPDINKMALPPCHVLTQFYVEDGKLSCLMFQRSCDVGLGVPFNIASYSLLTHLIAHICNLEAYEFIYFMGDVHIYLDHLEVLKEQIQRIPLPFPTIEINPDIREIDDFKYEDIKLLDYNSLRRIKMNMST